MGGAALGDDIDPKSIQKNSSLSTTFGLINSMVGGTMLLLPTLTIQAGLISSIVILAVSCFVSYITCAIFTKHMKESELDIQWPIKRILGKKWYAFFVIVCTVYLFFLCVLYYTLIIQMLYSMICFFMYLSGQTKGVDFVDPDDNDATFTLKIFSQQWIMIATFFPILAMLFMKNLNILVKIAEIGVYAIYSYIIFIFYCFIDNIHSGRVHEGTQTLPAWTWNIGNLGGTAALAFTIHTSFGNMIKCNKDQSKNVRDLGFTYIGGFAIYTIIAIIGAYGILNRDPTMPSLITQYFDDGNWGPFFVQFLYFGHLISILPIFFDIMKRRALPLVYGNKEKPKSLNTILNIIFVSSCFAIRCIPGISPDQITNFNGSLCCFFFVYLVPIIMHISCYHGKNPFLKNIQRKVSRFTEHRHSHSDDEDEIDDRSPSQNGISLQEQQDIKEEQQRGSSLEVKLLDNQKQQENNKEQHYDYTNSGEQQDDEQVPIQKKKRGYKAHGRKISCAPHEDVDERSLVFRLVFYGIIMVIGFCILVYGMYTIFSQF